MEDIYVDIERYRGLIDRTLVMKEDNRDFVEAEMKKFNNLPQVVRRLFGAEEPERGAYKNR